MSHDDFIQCAEEDWLAYQDFARKHGDNIEEYSWHWFWLILGEAVYGDLK